MKIKKGLIILGIAFFFLISFSMQCSAEEPDVSQTTIETIVLISGLIFGVMGIMLFFRGPAFHLKLLGIFLLLMGILLVVAVYMGAIQPTVG